jgi:hypothetical protein
MRKIKIPDQLTEQIKAQKKKLESALAKVGKFGSDFGSAESDAEKFEQEAAALELKADYTDDQTLEKIDRLRRKSRMARTKSENSGPIAQEILEKLKSEIDAAKPLIQEALKIDKENVTEQATAALAPFFTDLSAARNAARYHTQLLQFLGGQLVNGFARSEHGDPTSYAKRSIEAMETILSGFSPVEFVGADVAKHEA